jgi:hypothetical protein
MRFVSLACSAASVSRLACERSIALDPTTPYFVYLQQGNLYLRQGSREKALQAYADASRCASFYPEQKQLIEAQIKRVSSDPIDKVPELRNPAME